MVLFMFLFGSLTQRSVHPASPVLLTRLGRFKVYLYSKGITMQDLTDKTGISKKTLYNYLEGETNPSLMNIYKIANALDLDMSDLI